MSDFQEERLKTIMKAGAELLGDIIDIKCSGKAAYKLAASVIGNEEDKHTFSKAFSKVTTNYIKCNQLIRDDYDRLTRCDHVEIFFIPGEEIYNLDQSQLNRLGLK